MQSCFPRSIECNKKTVLFDSQNVLDSKIDNPTVTISKLTMQSKNQGKPFKFKISQGKRRSQERNNYHDRDRQQGRNRSSSGNKSRG